MDAEVANVGECGHSYIELIVYIVTAVAEVSHGGLYYTRMHVARVGEPYGLAEVVLDVDMKRDGCFYAISD
jgi:hypothetical protein